MSDYTSTPRTSSRLRSVSSSKMSFRMKTLFSHNSTKKYMKSLPNNFNKIHNNPNIYLIKDFLSEGEHKHLLSVSLLIHIYIYIYVMCI